MFAKAKHAAIYLWESRHNLPARLLLLTILFIVIAEIVVFIPSVAKFRYDWLQERIERAYLISVSFEVAQEQPIERETIRNLFSTAGILGVRTDLGDRSALILSPDRATDPDLKRISVDLHDPHPLVLMRDAFYNMYSPNKLFMMVQGSPAAAPDITLDIMLEKQPLRDALWRYAIGILGLSLIICAIVAGAVYATLLLIFVRPMVKLTATMQRFQHDPEDERALMIPSSRRDEIGQAERVLAEMQAELRTALRQKTRLATLGIGVSKINHDLKNVLASAMLMSERLDSSSDPTVKRLSPRLVAALDKAVTMCQATLDFGRADVEKREDVHLFDLVEEVTDALKLFTGGERPVRFINEVSPDCVIWIDRTQFFRALANLARNAAEALVAREDGPRDIIFRTQERAGMVIIDVADTGPGVADEARENLFLPFRGSVRQGGSGLGLAIAAEVVRAHDGVISLAETGPGGSVFRISLPAGPR